MPEREHVLGFLGAIAAALVTLPRSTYLDATLEQLNSPDADPVKIAIRLTDTVLKLEITCENTLNAIAELREVVDMPTIGEWENELKFVRREA